jgi:transcriptional regulator
VYRPPAFREDRLEVQHALIRAHPLGLLVTAGPGGLMANPLPFLVDTFMPGRGVLLAHLARANPQVQELAAVQTCLAVFQGPQDYVTPSYYASKREHGRVVPTWNYATVHAWGTPRLIGDAPWLRAQIEALTSKHEAPRENTWRVTDAPHDFVMSQMRAIIGVEIPIERIEGKWKVSQNRPQADRAGVVSGFREAGDTAMADLVAERGGSAPGG